MDKKRFFLNNLKKCSFSSKCCYGQKTIFSTWSQNNVLFLEILIFTNIWTKNDFSKMIWQSACPRNVDIHDDMEQKRRFPRNVDMCKKRLLQSDLQITYSSKKYWDLGIYGKKTIFSKWSKKVLVPEMLIFTEIWTKNVGFLKMLIWAKNDFFNVISKKLPFSRNVNIYVDMRYSELRGHSKTLKCCGGAWKCKDWDEDYIL